MTTPRRTFLASIVSMAISSALIQGRVFGKAPPKSDEPSLVLVPAFHLPTFEKIQAGNLDPQLRVYMDPVSYKLQQIKVHSPGRKPLKIMNWVQHAEMMDSGPIFVIDTASWQFCPWADMQPGREYLHFMLDHSWNVLQIDIQNIVRMDYDRQGRNGEPIAVYTDEKRFGQLWPDYQVKQHGAVEGTTSRA